MNNETNSNTNTNTKTNTKNHYYKNMIEFKYLKKNKATPINDKINDFVFNNKLLGLASVENCSNLCFGSMDIGHLTNNETICMINCFNKYSDSLLIGEKIYDAIKENKIRKTSLIKGDLQEFHKDIKDNLFS